MDCIFCSIVKKETDAHIVYEDDKSIVFLDINPLSRGHCLVVSKEHYRNIFDTPDDILAHMISVAKKIAKAIVEALKAEGVNIIMTNNRAAGQTVFHVHIHVLPRYRNDSIYLHANVLRLQNEERRIIQEKIKNAIGER